MGFGCNQRAVPLKDAGSSKSELEVSRSRRPPPQEPWISITVTWFVSCQGVRISDITGEDRPASARQHRQPQLGFQMQGCLLQRESIGVTVEQGVRMGSHLH